MTIRKVGGIYFWRVGSVGGSFHISKTAKRDRGSVAVDWFGVAACACLALPLLTF
ncbi:MULTISPECIES: hypothetical protein [unclassified Rhizobium]|uniref:hypothetical protein n=1 Tax=unclassified Rhizobium TaxID=2613769 RepID=UPI000A61126A|nr:MULTISPECIES: hypothetical protein [unclassified Rhizobium]